jgi:hypothetical protein
LYVVIFHVAMFAQLLPGAPAPEEPALEEPALDEPALEVPPLVIPPLDAPALEPPLDEPALDVGAPAAPPVAAEPPLPATAGIPAPPPLVDIPELPPAVAPAALEPALPRLEPAEPAEFVPPSLSLGVLGAPPASLVSGVLPSLASGSISLGKLEARLLLTLPALAVGSLTEPVV